MSLSSDCSLGSLRTQVRQRADIENNNFITDAELNVYISQSYKALYDLLVANFGDDYFVATTYQFTLTSSQSVQLPDGTPSFQNTGGSTAAKFYKLLGLDLQYSASPSGWISLKRFEFIERNKFAFPNSTTSWAGYTNLRYRIQGNTLYFTPAPMSGQVCRMFYIPSPTSLAYLIPASTTVNTTAVSLSDTTGLSTGMNVYGNPGIQNNTTISTLSSTSMTLSLPATQTSASTMIYVWNDSVVLDGIAGFEEFIVVDSAIKCSIKEEDDIQPLLLQRADIVQRIIDMSKGRDAGQAMHVSDALSINNSGWGAGGDYGDDGMGW